jgi:UDP-N-acetylglucosamine:LPS N-acetylglucosamine transferase
LKSSYPKPKMMVTLTGGGFLLEAQSLLRRLGDEFDYCYATGDDCIVPEGLTVAPVVYLRTFARLAQPHLWQRIPAFLVSLVQAFRGLRRLRPDYLVCVGTALAIPLCIAARVLHVRSVYIESFARFEKPSMTARIICRFKLANRIYVQWPDSVHLYAGGIYRGTVL